MNITIFDINVLNSTHGFTVKERTREASEMESRNRRWKTVNPGAFLIPHSSSLTRDGVSRAPFNVFSSRFSPAHAIPYELSFRCRWDNDYI